MISDLRPVDVVRLRKRKALGQQLRGAGDHEVQRKLHDASRFTVAGPKDVGTDIPQQRFHRHAVI